MTKLNMNEQPTSKNRTHSKSLTDRQADRQSERQTDRQTDRRDEGQHTQHTNILKWNPTLGIFLEAVEPNLGPIIYICFFYIYISF